MQALIRTEALRRIEESKGTVMTLTRRGLLRTIGVVVMTFSFGMGLGGLFGGCGGSAGTGPENTTPVELPLLDREVPDSIQTASFALG